MKLRKIVCLLCAAALLATGTGCSDNAATDAAPAGNNASADATTTGDNAFADAKTITIKFAENQSSTSILGVAAEDFAAKLAEKSNGTLQLDLYFDALLGDEATIVGMIEADAVEFTRVNLAAITATAPELGVLTLPYLYRDAIHCYNVMSSDVADELLAGVSNHGMVGISFLGGNSIDPTYGARCFYSSEPLDSLDALAGKKIRVQESEIVINMIKALGAVPTPMAYGEVFQALQTGVVDAAENDLMSYILSGHYEIAKQFTMDYHQFSPSIYVMSQGCYNQMTQAQKDVFTECLNEYFETVDKQSAEMQAEYRQQALDADCVFVECDNTPYQEACQAVYAQYPEFADYITRIQAVQ